MYAISFDLDTTQLQQQYPAPSWQNAYSSGDTILNSSPFFLFAFFVEGLQLPLYAAAPLGFAV